MTWFVPFRHSPGPIITHIPFLRPAGATPVVIYIYIYTLPLIGGAMLMMMWDVILSCLFVAVSIITPLLGFMFLFCST